MAVASRPLSAGGHHESEPSITFGRDGRSRVWSGQGLKIEIVDFDSRHVTITESGVIGGGLNLMTFRSEWSPRPKSFLAKSFTSVERAP